MTYKVSVIVPVYNVEPYIESCVNSLINQTLDELQLIFINNGCKDRSMDVVYAIAENRPNVDIVELKNNIGLPGARNVGLECVQGKYVSFVDSDDICDLRMFEKLFHLAERSQAQIAIANEATFVSDPIKCKDHHEQNWYLENSRAYPITGHPMQWMELAAWGKIILTSYAKEQGFKFTEGSLCCEEVPATTKLYLNASRIVTINETLYLYRNRPTSLSKKTNRKFVDDFLWAMSEQDKMLQVFIDKDPVSRFYILCMRLLLSQHILSHINKNDEVYARQKLKNAFEIFDRSFIQEVGLLSAVQKFYF